MSIEATLTRELNIRFIDARSISTEAKLELGINGYPTQDEIQQIICRSISIFQNKLEYIQETMHSLKCEFDAMKDASIDSHHGCSTDEVSSTKSSLSSSPSRKKWTMKTLSCFTKSTI